MVPSENHEVNDDDVTASLQTYRRSLLPLIPGGEQPLDPDGCVPITAIKPFENCWSALGMTILVIGGGVDDDIILELALKIIEEA